MIFLLKSFKPPPPAMVSPTLPPFQGMAVKKGGGYDVFPFERPQAGLKTVAITSEDCYVNEKK